MPRRVAGFVPLAGRRAFLDQTTVVTKLTSGVFPPGGPATLAAWLTRHILAPVRDQTALSCRAPASPDIYAPLRFCR